jgi:UrcA family protein
MLLRPVCLAIAIATAAFSAAPSSAEPIHGTRDGYETNVRYWDLDLSSDRGKQILLERIHDRAAKVCIAAAPEPPLVWGATVQSVHECVRETTERTLAKLNAPEVTAYYHRSQIAEVTPAR